MFWYSSNYSSAPVSPVAPSPHVAGGGSLRSTFGVREQASLSGEKQGGRFSVGPSLKDSVLLKGLAREEAEAAALAFKEREAGLSHERLYAQAGRNATRPFGGSGQATMVPLSTQAALSQPPVFGGSETTLPDMAGNIRQQPGAVTGCKASAAYSRTSGAQYPTLPGRAVSLVI